MTGRRSWVGLAVAVLAAVLLWWGQGDGSSPTTAEQPTSSESESETSTPSTSPTASDGADSGGIDPGSGLPLVALEDLPPEASETVDLIDAGGPYPYEEDDGVFGNFEQLLPDRERGYYREYTVETPGLDHRGARRIVAGSAGELYWTSDHYQSFERITR